MLCIVFVYSFIRLADYLIVNTMHVLAANSVATLLNYLEEQLQHTPSPSQIQGTSEQMDSEEEKPADVAGVEQKVFLSVIKNYLQCDYSNQGHPSKFFAN